MSHRWHILIRIKTHYSVFQKLGGEANQPVQIVTIFADEGSWDDAPLKVPGVQNYQPIGSIQP